MIKDICGVEMVTVYWEDGESEGGAGVGNAWADNGSYECEVIEESNELLFVRTENGEKYSWDDLRDDAVVVKTA